MSAQLDKVIKYFERDPELRVLFIFQDTFIADDLDLAEWPEGYRWVRFKGDWFTTKYHLDHEWANDKVVMFFNQASPSGNIERQKKFPLMDVLAANMEYHTQDASAFMQQYNIPVAMRTFVDKNIQQLQSSKMLRLLEPYYRDDSINLDTAVRAFISSFLGLQRVLDWDNILLEVIFLGRKAKEQKRLDFFTRIRKNPSVNEKLQKHLIDIFGTGYEENTEEKVGKIVQILKYNAIIQGLAPVDADDYKKYRINDSLALQQINQLLELAKSQTNMAQELNDVMNELGSSIHEDKIITWYGTDAKYSFIPDGLCIPIVKKLMSEKVVQEPTSVINRLEDLIIRHKSEDDLSMSMEYSIEVARYYEIIKPIVSLVLNSPDDYVSMYQQQWYKVDQQYRLSTETYYKLSPESRLFDTMQDVKLALDLNYAKLSNRMNLEWTKCIKDAGGMSQIHLMHQQDFYEKEVAPVQKRMVVIISDALRYEVAQELMEQFAKRRHLAHLEMALAMLPTETKFCKPSLFPHHSMELVSSNGEPDMQVDGKVLDKTTKRNQQISNYKEDAICVDYNTVSDFNKDKLKEIFKHKLVYIMHDVIDKNSHGAPAKVVTKSCRTAINELDTLMGKILDKQSLSITSIVVTSDHGFLFNDFDFQEKDKLNVEDSALEKKSRYYLTTSDEDVNSVTKYRLSEVSGISDNGNTFVAVPDGTNRIAVPGGDYIFAHGGASMEEMLIPILKIDFERHDEKKSVDFMILDKRLSIQSSRLRFKLLQKEAVSMDVRKRIVTCALYEGDTLVTPITEYPLDKTDPSPENRMVQVDLTLNKNINAKVLQLRICDKNDQDNPIIKKDVTNNTLIENDFDF